MWLMHKGWGHPWGDSPELAGDEGVWLGASSTSNTRTAWGATETAPRTPPEALAGPIWSGAGESVSGKAPGASTWLGRIHQMGCWASEGGVRLLPRAALHPPGFSPRQV